MLSFIRRKLGGLASSTSGNATLLMALGMPALIGGSGLAVDTAQWYMWKRELQFAVDQAALAGAWARAVPSTQTVYQARALQEFNSNIATTNGINTTPTVALTNYAGGTQNSVAVSATAAKRLPFSSFLTGNTTSVYAYAQAVYQEGESFSSCIIATDDNDSGAITISGNASLTASCGIAALSNSPTSIIINGSPQVDAGWVLSAGGIDDWFDSHTNDEVHENMTSLVDPFKTLTPPSPATSQVSRTYTCVKGAKKTQANVATGINTSYTYWKGADYNTAVQASYNKAKNPTTSTSSTVFTIVANETVDGVTTTTTITWTAVNGSSQNTIWEKKTVLTSTTQSGTVVTTAPDYATTLPGTYADMKVGCTTVFAPGIYVINGGSLDIDGQYQVTGAGVMFILKNGASVKINGGTNVNLTAMTTTQLVAQGVSSTEAVKLAGMLIFEDPYSSGTSGKNVLNGNTLTVLNGTVYLPKSQITFSGTATVTSQCLMVAANNITLSGTTNMSTFCPANVSEDTLVASLSSTVKLIA
jgi:Flp pilus assembly protein TadG